MWFVLASDSHRKPETPISVNSLKPKSELGAESGLRTLFQNILFISCYRASPNMGDPLLKLNIFFYNVS